MNDYYHDFLSSMTAAGAMPATTPDDAQPAMLQGTPSGISPSMTTAPFSNASYFPGLQDSGASGTTKGQKGRRKSNAGLGPDFNAIKHRRTRSGCFMCRSRRVKCDETRPVCERCKKGNRECVYPDPPSAKSSSSRSKETARLPQPTSPLSSNEDVSDEMEQEQSLWPIADEQKPDDDEQSPTHSSHKMSMTASNMHRLGTGESGSPSYDMTKSSPSASTVTTASVSVYPSIDFPGLVASTPDWSHLPLDMQRHLRWFGDNVTNFHYCITNDFDDFFKTILPNMAIRSEPLLNAVVGFSAYHSTFQNPNGKLQNFLHYYNRSVILLLQALQKKEKHSLGTLLTILQLATIEEYLGDWVNLMGHQKAAFEIITKMFTPQSVMQTPVGRMCLTWYGRFDNFVALMGGFPTDLPREWFIGMMSFHQNQAAADPEALRWKVDERTARLRLITYDMSILFAKGSRGQIAPDDFNQSHERLTRRLEEWRDSWDPVLTDARYLVKHFPHRRQPTAEDIVDPYSPGILYDFPLFSSTIIMAEWHSIMIMHKCQSSNTPPDQLFRSLGMHAYATCQYFETLERWPSTPKGTLILIQSCIAISALFLPQNSKHHMWCRRKFALLESMGYIHPLSLRTKMAQLFRDRTCERWWLPNGEGFSPILQSTRAFADDRNAAAVTAQQESLREVQHIFAKLQILEAAGGMEALGLTGA